MLRKQYMYLQGSAILYQHIISCHNNSELFVHLLNILIIGDIVVQVFKSRKTWENIQSKLT